MIWDTGISNLGFCKWEYAQQGAGKAVYDYGGNTPTILVPILSDAKLYEAEIAGACV